MRSDRLDQCAGTLSSGVDRRAVLRGAGQSSLAALLAAGLSRTLRSDANAAGIVALQDDSCPWLRVAAARGTQVDVGDAQCSDPCKCQDAEVFTTFQDLKVVLEATDCADVSGGGFPRGSVLAVQTTRRYRVPGPAGTWVGAHEGEFVIDTPVGQINGRLWGTDGLNSEDGSCTDQARDEGVLVGQGSGEFDGCEFVATYHGTVRSGNRRNPCSIDWSTWRPILTGVLTCPCRGNGGGSDCVGFEGLGLGKTYTVGDVFTDGGVTVAVEQFQWGNGTWTSDGFAEVQNGGMAGGSGNELAVNNVNLAFDFGGTVNDVSLAFGEYGGNLNIDVNGDFVNFDNFPDIDGATIGGVSVSVSGSSTGGGQVGTLRLSGAVSSFKVGGQELWIDDLCFA
jgi:hypothetical protein